MKTAQILRKKIDNEVITMGVLAIDHIWHGLIDILCKAGIDYMIIDQEHGAHNNEMVAEMCMIGRMNDFPILTRTIDCNHSTVRQAIDRGPCGLMLPCVESVEQLDMVRDSIYMPPRGKRRPGGLGNMWVDNINYSTWKSEVEDDFIILPQIETIKGLKNVDSIVRHELTTAIAVGPYDLSADMGVCWEPENPRHIEAIKKIRKAGKNAGKNMWYIGNCPELVREGFTFLCIGEPIGLLKETIQTINDKTKDTSPDSAAWGNAPEQ